jgi:hypothetical protein
MFAVVWKMMEGNVFHVETRCSSPAKYPIDRFGTLVSSIATCIGAKRPMETGEIEPRCNCRAGYAEIGRVLQGRARG